ncbi:MAG: MBL fold metallo-hydrolase [Bacteroidales bacterium]|nr:MBL fold metallo-hydrolase [Bacteroidales bacterium]
MVKLVVDSNSEFSQKVLSAPLGQTHLFFLGQAGFVVKTASGKYIGYDMYLSDCVYRTEQKDCLQRLLPQILDTESIPFDFIVASHAHRDHFDEDSLPELMQHTNARLIATPSCENDVERLRIDKSRCTFVSVCDKLKFNDIEFHFVPCDHGDGAPDAVGLVLSVDGKKIYFTGDTCLRLDMADYFRALGKFDVMAAPINGAWGNLDETECAAWANALQPTLTIPCHYGMFALHGGNPDKFAQIMKTNYPDLHFSIVKQGESIIL